MFLHGAGANLAMWGPVISHLDREFRCVAIDLPGHGALQEERFTLENAVARVGDVIAGLDERPVLVGLSLGGYVANATAAERPERVAGLVLSGATVEFQGATKWVNRFQGAVLPAFAPVLRRAATRALTKIGGADVAGEVDARGQSFRGAGQALYDLAGRDFHSLLERYEGPILILNGERDKHNIAATPAMLDGIEDVRVEILVDSGHSCAISQPKSFAEAVKSFIYTAGR